MLKRLALWSLPLLVIGVLFYWPMSVVLSRGLFGSWWATLVERQVGGALWFTLWQSVASMLACTALGLPMAYVLYRRRLRFAKYLRAILTVPFALPTIITAIGFTVFQHQHVLFANAGVAALFENPIFWIISAHVFVNLSVIIRTVGVAWATLPRATEEAAALGGAGRFRIFWSISLPQLAPSLRSAMSTIFLYCTASYGLVLVLGGGLVNSVETEIAYAANVRLDLQEASALAVLQTLISIFAFTMSSIGGGSSIGFEVHDPTHDQSPLDKRDWPVIAVTGFGLLAILSPLAFILWRSFTDNDGNYTLANFTDLGSHGERNLLNITLEQAALNSLRNVAVAATMATLVGCVIAYLLSRPTPRKHVRFMNRTLDILFMLPLGVSTIVLGFGYLLTFGSGPLPLRGSWLVVPLIQGLMALPLVIRIVYPAFQKASEELREQSATDGAGPFATFLNVELPIVQMSIGAALGYAAIVSVGEFGAASLLAYGSQATLPTVLYQLISRPGGNNYGMAMAMSAIVIAITFTVVLLASAAPENQHHEHRQKAAF